MEAKEISKIKYNELFSNEYEKANAFDKIAENYYFCNFGAMQKSDFDVLMFSIYLEQILNRTEENMNTYSDYTLSKSLGITQSRISSLKVKKQLKYPYDEFNWETSFARIYKFARYEDKKIKLNIPDKNLFIELKNFIEERHGYIELQLTPSLLVMDPEYFVDLVVHISNENRDKVKAEIKRELQNRNIDTKYFDTQPIGKTLKEHSKDLGIEVLCVILKQCIPIAGEVASSLIKKTVELLNDDNN